MRGVKQTYTSTFMMFPLSYSLAMADMYLLKVVLSLPWHGMPWGSDQNLTPIVGVLLYLSIRCYIIIHHSEGKQSTWRMRYAILLYNN